MDEKQFDATIYGEIAKLRGAYLNMSADLEFLLVDIICICLMSKEKERNYVKEILVSGTMLSNKIKHAKKALRIYDENLVAQYRDCFTAFGDLNTLRNKFSHSRIEGDEKRQDLDILVFISYLDGELKEDFQSRRDLLSKLPNFAKAIHTFTSGLIPHLYYQRHVTRYDNILQFPSNRSKSYWLNYQLEKLK